ncbi:MAG: hypothetical protein M3Y06_08715, partial [Actinomycetota bacterium]|nr:hypothetical protein [Actinomycetota bacterium]
MVLIALLAVAVVCVIIGVITASAVWLIISLVASVLAAAVLLRSYLELRKKRTVAATTSAGAATSSDVTDSGQVAADSDEAGADPGRGGASDSLGVTEPAPVVASTTTVSDVLVIDGSPEFHRPGCTRITGEDAVAIPLDQAVGDGFAECEVCTPTRASAPTGTPVSTVKTAVAEASARTGDVWVVDGYPDYHRKECRELRDRDAVPIPHDEAVEDGFHECSICNLESANAGQIADEPVDTALTVPVTEPAPLALVDQGESTSEREDEPVAGAQVWVVDGYPEYHRQDCRELRGREAEPVPHEQA